jgi:mono/diheme cytochrome c family protein
VGSGAEAGGLQLTARRCAVPLHSVQVTARFRGINQSGAPASPSQSGPGLRVFEAACIGCHQFDGKGAASNFASLVGSRTVNDPAGTNAAQALIGGHILASRKLRDSCRT